MQWLSVKDAATRLGVSGSRVYQLRSLGVLARNESGEVSSDDVRKHERLRHQQATGKLGGEDRLALIAGGVRERLHPIAPHLSPLSHGPAAVERLDGDLVAALGFNCVFEAAKPDTAGCRWCWSHVMFRVNGGVDPADTPVYRALFGGEPCLRDRKRWADKDDALVASGIANEAKRMKHRKEQQAAKQTEDERLARARLKRASDELAAVLAQNPGIRRSRPAAQPVRASGAVGAGADATTYAIAKLLPLLDAAAQRGDTARHTELLGQINRLRSELRS